MAADTPNRNLPFTYRYMRAVLVSGALAGKIPPRWGVLWAYISHANKDGIAFPGAERLARQLGCDKRSVYRARKWLMARGFLQVEVQSAGRKPTRWRLTLPHSSAPNPDASYATVGAPQPWHFEAATVTPACHTTVTPACHTNSYINSSSNSRNSKGAAAVAQNGTGRASLVAVHGEDRVAGAEREVQRRMAAGRKVFNPHGLVVTLLKDPDFTPTPPPAPKRTEAEIAAGKAEIERQNVAFNGRVQAVIEAERAAERAKKAEQEARAAAAPPAAPRRLDEQEAAATKAALLALLERAP